MTSFKSNLLHLTFLLFVLPLFAQPIQLTAPEEVGISSERLAKVNTKLQSYIDENKVGGIVSLVARKGKVVHFESFGYQDREQKTPMDRTSIFRIFSMTKPIASVALMTLYEEGKFQLSDPVAKYLPEFKEVKVYEDGALVKPKTAMTIEHVLTHSSGLSYGWDPTPVDSMYAKANIWTPGASLEDFSKKIATLPLNFHPGTQWKYGVSTDIVGRLVEVISGKPLDKYMKERIFTPLGMNDTGFSVPSDKHDRFTRVYSRNQEGGISPVDAPVATSFKGKVTMFSGGGGLVSTANDYLRFAQMMLNGGELDGTRILGKKTVELMTRNHLADDVFYKPGAGFGIGFEVVNNNAHMDVIGSDGEFYWSGMANTFFWIDPEEEMVSMVFTQFLPYGFYPLPKEFKNLVYQSIVE